MIWIDYAKNLWKDLHNQFAQGHMGGYLTYKRKYIHSNKVTNLQPNITQSWKFYWMSVKNISCATQDAAVRDKNY